MDSTTPERGPQVAGEPAAARLMRSLDYRLSGAEALSEVQVAIVLHALADHTAIQAALAHRPDPTSPWPHATSMGRWFHDVADQLTESVQAPASKTVGRPFRVECQNARGAWRWVATVSNLDTAKAEFTNRWWPYSSAGRVIDRRTKQVVATHEAGA